MSDIGYSPRREVSFAPPKSDLGMWQDRREQASKDRRRYEPTWAICQSFIANKQWVGWSKRDRRIISEPNPQNRERHTVNVLTSYLMTNVGKLISDDMLPTLYFGNDSPETVRYAKHANGAVRYAWEEELEADQRLYEVFMSMCTFGLGGIQHLWNPSIGPVMAEQVPYLNGEPILDPEKARAIMAQNYLGQGTKVEMKPVRGAMDWRVLSPHNILPPPGVEHERHFPWLILEFPVPLEQIRARFPDKGEAITEENLASVDMLGLRDVMNDSEGVSQTSMGKLRNHATLYTGYEMPTGKYPNGRTVTWAQDMLLEERPRLPQKVAGQFYTGVRFFKYTQIPKRFWPIGLIEPGIGPQRQRNRSRSQYIELKDRAGLGRVYARPNALSVEQLPGGKIMEVVTVRPGAEIPTETLGLGPGPWMAQDIQMHDSDLDKVMGMGQVTLGQGAPGGVSAYSAMALLAQQDDQRVGPILKHARLNIAWLVKFMLNDAKTYWGPQKKVMLGGDDGSLEQYTFDATKLPDDVYVRVGTGAPSPRNQAAEIQKIMDIYDRAVAGGKPLPVQWLYDSLQAGKALPIPESMDHIQREKAELENLLIARGGAVNVHPTDVHAIHIEEHNEAAAMHSLVPDAEDIVRALMEHVQEHEQAQQSSAMAGASAPGLQGGFGAAGGSASGMPSPVAGLPAQQPGG